VQILFSPTPALFLLLWQLAASVIFLKSAGIILGLPPLLLGSDDKNRVFLFLFVYLSSSTLLWFLSLRNNLRGYVTVLGVSVVALVIAGFQPLIIDSERLDREMAALAGMVVILNFCLYPATRGSHRRTILATALLAGLLLATIHLSPTANHLIHRTLGQPQNWTVRTSKHNIRIGLFHKKEIQASIRGGALTRVGDQLLLVNGDGKFFFLDFDSEDNEMNVRPLDFHAPMNTSEFRQQMPPHNFPDRFRTLDTLVLDTPDASGGQLLVSYQYWDIENACYTMRISVLQSTLVQVLNNDTGNSWRTLYQTVPCVPVDFSVYDEFRLVISGGKMVQTDSGQILLSVGVHVIDGEPEEEMLSQDMSSPFGKIIEIDVNDGSSLIFASGFRNPLGLHIDGLGNIWSTDNGPEGGDELNLVQYGGNYGWPLETLGTQYGKFTPIQINKSEPGIELTGPKFAWNPSLGVSALTRIEHGEFHRWKGDLIVSSMNAKSLFRLPLGPDGPVLAEPVPVGVRIRDIELDRDGRLIFWTDDTGEIGLVQTAPD
jgi:hypothetical protein